MSSLGFTVASFIDKNCKRFVQCFDVPAIGMYVCNEGFVERETVFIFRVSVSSCSTSSIANDRLIQVSVYIGWGGWGGMFVITSTCLCRD
jgi:hypothetical protein